MAILILCLVIFLQLIWIFLLKLQIERLKMDVTKDVSRVTGAPPAQKGMRSFVIGK